MCMKKEKRILGEHKRKPDLERKYHVSGREDSILTDFSSSELIFEFHAVSNSLSRELSANPKPNIRKFDNR